MLLGLIAMNAKAQFVQIDGKDPVLHIPFDSLTVDGARLFTDGTDMHSFTTWDGREVVDTIEGHGWGGGSYAEFTYENQIVAGEKRELPVMYWNSFADVSVRPQGIAVYSRANDAYPGPFNGKAVSVSFYVKVTADTRIDTANGAWDGAPQFYGLGDWEIAGGGVFFRYEPTTMEVWVEYGTDNRTSYGEGVFAKDEWVHVAYVIPTGGARSDIKLYINGVETFADDEVGDATVITITPKAAWDGIIIGKHTNTWMADYRVYDVELTAAEVAQFGQDLPTSGISTAKSANDFSVYPVPNNGIFNIEFNNNETRNIKIINMLGQTMHSQLIKGKDVVSVNELPKGAYFISAENEDKVISIQKIIIE